MCHSPRFGACARGKFESFRENEHPRLSNGEILKSCGELGYLNQFNLGTLRVIGTQMRRLKQILYGFFIAEQNFNT